MITTGKNTVTPFSPSDMHSSIEVRQLELYFRLKIKATLPIMR